MSLPVRTYDTGFIVNFVLVKRGTLRVLTFSTGCQEEEEERKR